MGGASVNWVFDNVKVAQEEVQSGWVVWHVVLDFSPELGMGMGRVWCIDVGNGYGVVIVSHYRGNNCSAWY